VTTTITNYDGGIVTAPAQVLVPGNVQELQAILRDTDRYPSPLRAMGSFHSLTPCPASTGTVVRMERINRVVAIDRQAMTVTAEAGLQIGRLAVVLRKEGLQLLLNIEIGNATVGSLACCHSKDAMDGVEHGQVCSYVTRIRWVDPAGELQEAAEDNDPDLLYLVRSSNGLCGVCYEVTLRVKPIEIIKFEYTVHDSRALTQEHIDRVAAGNQAMVCWTIGHTTVVQTRNQADRLQRAWLARLRYLAWTQIGALVGRNIRRCTPAGAVRTAVESVWLRCQQLVYRILSGIGGFALYGPDKIMNYKDTPPAARYAFTFWAFPFDRWVDNLHAYLDFSEDHFRRYGFRCNMPLGSYFIKKDASSILSYTHEGDVLSLDPIHSYREEDEEQWHRFLREFNAWAYARGGIPLLNQSPFVERAHVVAAYGARWQQFSDWVAKADPGQRMRNEFFADLLHGGLRPEPASDPA
jgi:FAD/FMN-containing dehydrogenase